MGTKIKCSIMRVIDADTLQVKINGQPETVRLLGTDTEECREGVYSKPPTNAGKLAAHFAHQYWWGHEPTIEFDTDDPLEICLNQHRDYFGRVICYLWRGDENYNLRLVSTGHSPYFQKYGRSRLYHEEFAAAQLSSFKKGQGIWDKSINKDGPTRRYDRLLPWWQLRGDTHEGFRVLAPETAKSIHNVTQPCDNLCRLIRDISLGVQLKDDDCVLFCDFLIGVSASSSFSSGVLCSVGVRSSAFRLWIPGGVDCPVKNAIAFKYSRGGCGYGYIKGRLQTYRGNTQIVVRELSDSPTFETSVKVPEELLSPTLPESTKKAIAFAVDRRIHANRK